LLLFFCRGNLRVEGCIQAAGQYQGNIFSKDIQRAFNTLLHKYFVVNLW